jgi:phage shock protein C
MKKLYRSKKNRMVAGVCAGLAEYFKIDVNIIRVLTIVLVLATGIFPIVVAYGIAYWLIPEEGDPNIIDGEVK